MTEVLSQEEIDQLLSATSSDSPFWKKWHYKARRRWRRVCSIIIGKWKRLISDLRFRILRNLVYECDHVDPFRDIPDLLFDFDRPFHFKGELQQWQRVLFRWKGVDIYRRYFNSKGVKVPVYIIDEEFRNILSLEDVLKERNKQPGKRKRYYLKAFNRLKVEGGQKKLYSTLAVEYPDNYKQFSPTEIINKLMMWYEKEFGNDSALFSEDDKTLKVHGKKTFLYWDTFLGERVDGLARCPEELWPSIIRYTSMKDLDRMLRGKRHISVFNGFDFSNTSQSTNDTATTMHRRKGPLKSMSQEEIDELLEPLWKHREY